MSEFTVRGDAGFERCEAGAVAVRIGRGKPVVIPASEWASIVAHVAAGGGTAEDYAAAEQLHAGEIEDDGRLNLGCRPLARGPGIGA